jgi:ribonuclease HII
MPATRDEDGFFGHNVIGIDEAGRGPLAGPVVAAGVMLDPNKPILGLNDSKKLTAKARDFLFHEIVDSALFVEIQEIDAETIDRLNILQATLLAFKNIILAIPDKNLIEAVLIDGHLTVPGLSKPKQIAIVSGDHRISCIMAASIVAKVHRDRLMAKFHDDYPDYGFLQHKGYGTLAHLEAIEKWGPSPIHRRSFSPIKDMVLLDGGQ